MGAFPDVPTLKEQGIDWALGAWRSFVGPKGMPQEAIDVLVPAFAKVVKDPDFVKFMNKRGFQIVYRDPAGLKKWYKQADKDMGGVLKAVGLVK